MRYVQFLRQRVDCFWTVMNIVSFCFLRSLVYLMHFRVLSSFHSLVLSLELLETSNKLVGGYD